MTRDVGPGLLDQDASTLTEAFEQKIQLLSRTLESVGSKCHILGSRLVKTEDESQQFAER